MDPGERAGRLQVLDPRPGRQVHRCIGGVFAGNGTRVITAPVRSPRASSCAGRFAGTLRRGCPGHVLIVGGRHLREVLAGYARRCNGRRPHQGLRREPPVPGRAAGITARIGRGQVLGGLISEYRRAGQ
jgi:hypothetical protein